LAKILIIEDRRENIVFVANNILKPLGHDVITAMDGQTGLTKAQEETPDLIITDLKLPRMSGLEIMARLQKRGIIIPTIVMTFHGTEDTAVQALRLGARDYLVKPFSVEEMHAALDRALKPQPGTAPEAGKQANQAEARVAQLQQELTQMRAVLAKREMQMQQMQKQLAECIKKVDLAVVAQRAAAWEEDNARLNQVLAQNKEKLSTAESHARALEEAIAEQKTQLRKHQQESKRVIDELHHLTTAFYELSQDLEHQLKRLDVLTPREKKQQ
jgi:DNA-binding response OmpR family regulator